MRHHRYTAADLLALPSDFRLVRVNGNKRPTAGEDWFTVDDFSPDDAAALNGSGPPAWGLKTGPCTGLLVLDLDAEGWRESFQRVTHHPITDLPPTIAWSSGKQGRSGHVFAVDPEWWPALANRRSWKNASGETCWELRWDRCQSVIVGAHPETGCYRWLPGRSPQEIPDPASAPDWLLEALLVQEHPAAAPVVPTANDANRAVAMLQHIEPSAHSSYSDWLRVGMALHHTDPGLLTAWVDWSRQMVSFDEVECLTKWQSFGKGHKGRAATIATLHHLAKAGGYREPKRQEKRTAGGDARHGDGVRSSVWAPGDGAPLATVHPLPAPEDQTYSQLIGSILEAIRRGTEDDEMELRAVLKYRFRLSDEKVESALFKAYSAEKVQAKAPTGEGVNLDEIKPLTYLMDGWILRGDVVLTYGAYGTGKTTLGLAKAYAHITGRNLLDRDTPCQPGKVLFIATDSGVASLRKVMQDLGLDPSSDPLLTEGHPDQRFWVWGHAPEQGQGKWCCIIRDIIRLEQFITRKGITYVVIDSAKSVSSVAGWSYTSNESVKALLGYIREGLAQPTGACIEFLSHDGTVTNSHAGAKAWAEEPSIVCQLTSVGEGDGPVVGTKAQFRKDRAATVDPRRSLTYHLRDGELALEHGGEVVGSCADAILTILWDAHRNGLESLSTAEVQEQAMRRFQRPRKTVENTLGAIAGSGKGPNPTKVIKPRRGRYALAPAERQRREAAEAAAGVNLLPNKALPFSGGGKD